jgi:hypothetical protein
MAVQRKSKLVRSDLKDVTPGKRGAAFPHDLEQTPKSRKTRRRKAAGARSGNAPSTIARPDPERRGGRDRAERKRRARPAA